ncbi:SBBP repeat-containing protein [Tenacibaculum sp.]|nr:SBBP repeat-containing protein [Tenacibaculum sp.]
MKKLLITLIIMLIYTHNELHSQEFSPTPLYSTYLGSFGTDDADVVAVDPVGNTYLGCHSSSVNLLSNDKHPYIQKGGMDAFVVKLNSKGNEVNYLTHLGGTEWDAVQGIISDSFGNVYAVGTTYSSDFPINSNGYQPHFGGKSDAFVVKLNSDGKVVWSTFLGGSKDEDGRGIIIDKDGKIHIIGRTESNDFPTSDRALQPKSAGGIDAFITTLDSNGKMLTSTYLGGSGDDIGFAIALDSIGQLYVAGTTNSSNFPIKNAIQEENKGEDDAFLAVIDPTRSVIKFASYFGGEKSERLYNIDLNSSGDVFMMGVTNSSSYPTTGGAFQPDFGGVRDAFVTRINLQKRNVVYSTYLGGENNDDPRNLAVDEKGNIFIVGYTGSKNFPTVNNQKTKLCGRDDAFVTIFDSSGSFLHYSTFFGGEGRDFFEGIALGTDGSLTVSGGSSSTDFPTVNALQDTFVPGGRFDIVVTRFMIPKYK